MTSRRRFLGSGAVAVAFVGLRRALGQGAFHRPPADRAAAGYGPLIADPGGIFDLPQGFSYTVVNRAGDPMNDGLLTPSNADGMAAFPGPTPDRVVLVRNHELDLAGMGAFGPNWQLLNNHVISRLYDARGGQPPWGGTTTLIYNTTTRRLEQIFLSLAGTLRNCAGGATPWGSWLSCEESVQRRDGVYQQEHGYIFEVPADHRGGPVVPVPLVAMGRFNHEAAAVDPLTGIVYLTEDRADGCLYRFVPQRRGDLPAGGVLQALAIPGAPAWPTGNNVAGRATPVGVRVPLQWVTLLNVTAPLDDLRLQAQALGAAIFTRAEGIAYADGVMFLSCTTGGANGSGQVFRLWVDPRRLPLRRGVRRPTQEIELFLEPNSVNILDHGDNVTVAPWGDLLLCEDGVGCQFLVGVTPDGAVYQLGRNALNGFELTGVTFAPDGRTLFVNLQWPGWTLAITGPF